MIDILTDEQFVEIFFVNYGLCPRVARKVTEEYGIPCTAYEVLQRSENFPGLHQAARYEMLKASEKSLLDIAKTCTDEKLKLRIAMSLLKNKMEPKQKKEAEKI